ncbi:AMIN-like domain-containing (lipo)protein [Geodermatophilus sp. SYSU D00815]
MRRTLRTAVLVLATVLAALTLSAPAQAAASPYCGITWGSLAKGAGSWTDAEVVTDVRAGRHSCYDRLVIDLGSSDNAFRSYQVRYVDRVVADGSGAVIPVRGGARLQVTVGAAAYDENGDPTFGPTTREVVPVDGYRTFRQVAFAGSFEGRTDFGLGVRARLPFRVFVLAGAPYSDQGPRLVIDVAHAW